MIPLYILGILQRYGPQHGYNIKKLIADQLSDFTQIKLPTIYYHLGKMEADGLLTSNSEKGGLRPEKTIYSITTKGLETFKINLSALLDFDYRPIFTSDSVFFFSEHLETIDIGNHLEQYIVKLEAALKSIEKHKDESLSFIPENMRKMAEIIFSHHEHHYQAELEWAQESLKKLI
jgi:DNA-binding PadR family transcriptional regulator